MALETTQEEKEVRGYPADGWLKGYFYRVETDRRDGERRHERSWKNWDYLRLKDFALHLLEPRAGRKILDIGCGDGAMMVYCGLQGAEVHGQDLDRESVAKANEYLARFGIRGKAVCGDVSRMAYAENFFDAAVSGDFMEHVPDETKVKVLREVRRCLKPGAPLVIKTPNLSYLRVSLAFKRLRALLTLKNPMRYWISHSPGTDDPQHVGLTTRWRLTRCLLQSGFTNYEFRYAPFRRLGHAPWIERLSTETVWFRDLLCEDLFCRTWKPIVSSHFPD